MELQEYLIQKFKSWQPPAPEVVARGKGDITLTWKVLEPFGFLGDELLYRLEKNNKLPKWAVVYSGGKTTKRIDNLAPRYPHKFRLKVILSATAVPLLAELALQHYGNEDSIVDNIEQFSQDTEENTEHEDLKPDLHVCVDVSGDDGDRNNGADIVVVNKVNKKRDIKKLYEAVKILKTLKQNFVDSSEDKLKRSAEAPKWIASQWSEQTWSNTDSDGTSAACFCMAVKCGYLKQVQMMLDERPELVGIVNSGNGFTPLATAIRRGDINTVRFLVSAGAEVNQPCSAGKTPLHLAVLAGDLDIVELLLEKGADLQARDWNDLRAEHYAVESCRVDMVQYILDRGDVHVTDNNGWSPLFRALCQGADTAIVEELVTRGSDIHAVDNAGLPLVSVAKLLKNRHGRRRDSILRLVDSHYPHEKALANFTRLTKKIYNVHSLLKLN